MEIFIVSSALILKQLFLKIANPFHKTGVPFFNWKKYGWKHIILYKTALSEAGRNRIGSTKWIYYKERVLPVTNLFFGKFCFSLWISYKELTRCTTHPNVDIHTFEKHWSFIWECFFPLSILEISYDYYHWRWNWF